MSQEKKKKLRNIAILSLLILLGGTFAFQAFNQQAINDRLRENQVEVGGRVHDYYNRDTENKDVFVENYGREKPIILRVRLSEYMDIQKRGERGFTPIAGGTREDVDSWTTWKPSEKNINDRVGDSDAFDPYSKLTFGWERNGEYAPWYLPTFNHDKESDVTAAAGHARDYIKDGATHPGDGTDAYWSEGESYDNSNHNWHGSAVTRETAQHLPQEEKVMTLKEWLELPNNRKIGYFWVVDHETGWAYWASMLDPGYATSYLLDAAKMTAEADQIPGSYYYAIHVESQLISPDELFKDEPRRGYGGDLGYLLEGIRNGAVDDETGNPGAGLNSRPEDFNFSAMNPGRLFTMSGQQFRYLEEMEDGHHLIIRNDSIDEISWNNQESALTSWYSNLNQNVKAVVRPVADSFTTGAVDNVNITFDMTFQHETGWIPTNLSGDVAKDETKVDESGTPRAFALSLADVTRLSGPGRAFTSGPERAAGIRGTWWWLRTPAAVTTAWSVSGLGNGGLLARARTSTNIAGGMRPALIIHQ